MREKVHGESSVAGWDETMSAEISVSTDSECGGGGCTLQVVHQESTVSGFEETRDVLVTRTPTLVDIHAETLSTIQSGPVLNRSQATATKDDLLFHIISYIGILPSPTNNGPSANDGGVLMPSGPDAGNDNEFQQTAEASSGQTVLDSGPTPTMTVGDQMTFGSAVLTLTPGLSSVLGDGSTATYIAIATNDIGQTLITVSSSGTVITATVTDAPATITKPKTGSVFDARTTPTARSSNIDSMRTGIPDATASSQGVAVRQSANIGCWACLRIGFAGLGLLLG